MLVLRSMLLAGLAALVSGCGASTESTDQVQGGSPSPTSDSTFRAESPSKAASSFSSGDAEVACGPIAWAVVDYGQLLRAVAGGDTSAISDSMSEFDRDVLAITLGEAAQRIGLQSSFTSQWLKFSDLLGDAPILSDREAQRASNLLYGMDAVCVETLGEAYSDRKQELAAEVQADADEGGGSPSSTDGFALRVDGKLTVREGPGTAFPAVDILARDARVSIECGTVGDSIEGNDGRGTDKWYRILAPAEGYVAGAFVDVQPQDRQFDECLSVPESPPVAPREPGAGASDSPRDVGGSEVDRE